MTFYSMKIRSRTTKIRIIQEEIVEFKSVTSTWIAQKHLKSDWMRYNYWKENSINSLNAWSTFLKRLYIKIQNESV